MEELIGKEVSYLQLIIRLPDKDLLSVLGGAIKAAKLIADGNTSVGMIGPNCIETVSRLIGRELVRRSHADREHESLSSCQQST